MSPEQVALALTRLREARRSVDLAIAATGILGLAGSQANLAVELEELRARLAELLGVYQHLVALLEAQRRAEALANLAAEMRWLTR